MAKHSSLPTSRSRRRGAPQNGAAPHIEPSGPPRAPRGLTRTQAQARRALWAEPIARYWAPSDDVFVVRLVRLREQLDELGGDAPLGMYAACLALERTLYLTPGARAERLKAASAEPPAPDVPTRPNPRSSSTGTSARERERLLRGCQ